MMLTDDEKRMRDGAEGPAVAAAMDLLIRYGRAVGADRLCDVRNVAGTMTQPSPIKAALVKEGGWDKAFAVINLDSDGDFEIPAMRVPTCQLQHGFGQDALDVIPYPRQSIELQQDAESFYGRHGVNILATCTPYQVGNLPTFGEHCAWMESSAVVYANSALGARTNCEGIASTGAASLTGKVPCTGNHLDENRRGTHLVHVDPTARVDSFLDWGMLGYFAGGIAGEDRPVVTGALGRPDLTDLKHFGAAAATSGGVELYHIPGVTPEAPTVEAAFCGKLPATGSVFRYGPAERRRIYETLNEIGDCPDVDFVLLGCPHASVDQVRDVAAALDGRSLSPSTELWIMVPRALREIADRSGYTAVIQRAGGRVLTDSCPAMSRVAPAGTRVFATDSAKQAHYLPAILGIEAWFGTTRECVDAAVTGRWAGGLPGGGAARRAAGGSAGSRRVEAESFGEK
jgi:predicted aconitase